MLGFIVKAISGFYYCKTADGVYECKARGSFRSRGISPLAGDRVEFSVDGNNKGIIEDVLQRKNEFLRPPMANLDKLFIVVSTVDPSPNSLVVDKLIAICEYKTIEPILIVTKTDIGSIADFTRLYRDAGYKIIELSNLADRDFTKVYDEIKNSVSAFAGNTGVGKSSLMNNLFPELMLQTGEISKKLGRGRHTTRQVEFFCIDSLNAKIADTPGFGNVDVLRYDVIHKADLAACFREFLPYIDKCKFTGCSHTVEKGCAVLEALEKGSISTSRFESYKSMYTDAEQIKDWETKKQ